MPKRQKFRVYLAGPLSGCNDYQKRKWRDAVKQKYSKDFDWIDPNELIDPSGGSQDEKATTSSQIVEADLRSIGEADGLLANMWRESIGTAIGVVHANRAGKPVVVADPNHLDSKTLAFYADTVEETPLKAAKVLRDLLRAEAHWSVRKKLPRQEEPFDRLKLAKAIRAACRGAGRDTIVGPGFILPKVIDHLKESSRQMNNQFPTSLIDKEVLEALKELECDPALQPQTIQGVSAEWELVRDNKHRDPLSHTPNSDASQSSASQIGVEISCGAKSHGTIWGKTVNNLQDIPSTEARRVFNIIQQIPGITRIMLGPFGHQDSRTSCKATVSTSTTPCVIEGKLFDKGEKGTMQSFQVKVQFDSETDTVQTKILKKLEEQNYL